MASKKKHFIRDFISEISTINKCLIIFMSLLIFQQIYTIFFQTPISNIDDGIDVIFRTSLASIFGYMLSSNFSKKKPRITTSTNSEKINLSNPKIGFTNTETQGNISNHYTLMKLEENNTNTIDIMMNTETNNLTNTSNDNEISPNNISENNCQIIIATIIGIISLFTLLIYRDFIASNNPPIAAISQVRDLASGAIGFLLGSPSNKSDN